MGSKSKEKKINCQLLTLNRQSGDRNVWQLDYPTCLLYLYCLKGSVSMGSKRKEKKQKNCQLLVLLVYPVLILTSNNHRPHRLKDWKPKRGKCKQIIKSVYRAVSLWIGKWNFWQPDEQIQYACEVTFFFSWCEDLLTFFVQLKKKFVFFYLSWPSMANYFELNFDFFFVWRCPPVCTKLIIFFFINGLRGNRYLHLEQYLYLRS